MFHVLKHAGALIDASSTHRAHNSCHVVLGDRWVVFYSDLAFARCCPLVLGIVAYPMYVERLILYSGIISLHIISPLPRFWLNLFNEVRCRTYLRDIPLGRHQICCDKHVRNFFVMLIAWRVQTKAGSVMTTTLCNTWLKQNTENRKILHLAVCPFIMCLWKFLHDFVQKNCKKL